MKRILVVLSLFLSVNIVSGQQRPKITYPFRPVTEKEDDARSYASQAYFGHYNLAIKNGRVKRHVVYSLKGENDGYYFSDSLIVNVSMPSDETLQLRIANANGDILLNCERKGAGKCSFSLSDLPMDKVYELSFYNTSGKLTSLASFVREEVPEGTKK